MLKKTSSHLPLIAILTLAIVLRLYQFGTIPHGLNRDEASIGYTAYLIWNKGMDEYQHKLPLHFKSFGDWKQPLYIYAISPLVGIFGLSAITVRSLSLIFSLLMIITAYYLTSLLTTKYSLFASSLAALFLALNPWHFHFSHLALEPIVAASIGSLAVLFLLKKHYPLGFLFLLLSMLTYHAALVFIPLFAIAYITINHQLLKSKKFISTIIVFFSLTLFLLATAYFSPEQDKVTGTVLFNVSNEQLYQQIYQYRTPSVLSKLIHNRFLYFGTQIIQNYIRTFTPQFLIQKGGTNNNYNLPGFGNFYALEIILAIIGLIYFIKHPTKNRLLILSAIFIAPIPAAITVDGVHSTREIFLLPYIQILTTTGAISIIKKFPNTYFLILNTCLIFILTLQAIPYYQYYFTSYKNLSDTIFYGYHQPVSNYIHSQRLTYSHIYITYPFESPYIFYAFYNHISPKEFLSQIKHSPADRLGFYHASQLDNLYFIPSVKDLPNYDLTNSLILARTREVPNNINPQKIFYNLYNQPEIIAWELNP